MSDRLLEARNVPELLSVPVGWVRVHAPASIQAQAGHSDFSTTERYINLAGGVFRPEVERAEARIFGTAGVPEMGTETADDPAGAEVESAG